MGGWRSGFAVAVLLFACHHPAATVNRQDKLLESGLSANATGLEVSLRVLREVAGQSQLLDDTDSLHSGDRLRLELWATQAAYLYVVYVGADGSLTTLFPSAGYQQMAGRCRLLLPPSRALLVADPAGDEELRVVASLKPLPQADRLLCEELRLDCNSPPAPSPAPTIPCSDDPPQKTAPRTRRLVFPKIVVGKDQGQGVASLRYLLPHR